MKTSIILTFGGHIIFAHSEISIEFNFTTYVTGSHLENLILNCTRVFFQIECVFLKVTPESRAWHAKNHNVSIDQLLVG